MKKRGICQKIQIIPTKIEEIIKSYHDERIRYFYAPNQGLGSALAAACKEARGRYIARMDDDDIAMPNRLDKELAFLELHPDYIVYVSSLQKKEK